MKQRLVFARSLINRPSILFLDEPTSGLDPRGREEMLALILDIPQLIQRAEREEQQH